MTVSVRENRGFTLIEIVAVLILLGIMGMVVATRTASVNEFESVGEVARLKTHIRFAQQRAMKTDEAWGIRVGSATTYWLFKGTPATRVALPGETADTVTLSALSATAAPLTITFDGYGSPGPDAVVLSTSGADIQIAGNTGFIP